MLLRGAVGRRLVWPALIVAITFSAGVLHPVEARADVLNGAQDTQAGAPPQTPLERGTRADIDGFQNPDPSSGIDIIEPPEPDGFGGVQLRHPIEIPPGRSKWQPQISLAYDSGGENGWLGVGWDVSLDAIRVPGLGSDVSADSIEVDTRWGVPRYDDQKESETYVYGDEQLSPTAHRPDQEPRQANKIFKKRVEGDFLRILRHGDDPTNYWFEVHDKLGNKYFYGGALNQACADTRPANPAEPKTPCREDDNATNAAGGVIEEAVLRDNAQHITWWGLREKWDISTNVVTYYYDHTEDTGVGDGNQAGAPKGRSVYLSHINYSGSKLADVPPAATWPAGRLPRFGPYDVRFVRDSQLPNYQRRPDVETDAMAGFLEVDAELLKHIDITYEDRVVRSYKLDYVTGPFGKTLLKSVSQAGADSAVFAKHDFDYYDDIRRPDGTYDGFDPLAQPWDTGEDHIGKDLLFANSESALGKTTGKGGDGRLFLGFGLLPDKTVAVGGGLQFAGGDSRGDLETIDINGDNLPDKVFRDGQFDVKYRLNTSGPHADLAHVTYSEPRVADFLPGLSEDSDFSTGISVEAYVFASLMYAHTWTWAKQSAYFSDVNADGLPDYVIGGQVLFNHLSSDGQISFLPTSDGTNVEIQGQHIADPGVLPDFTDIEAEQEQQFPRQDTLRRWLAPADGDITIDAPVHLIEVLDNKGVVVPSKDGVRLTIQQNATELWSVTIPGGDLNPRTPNLGPVHVAAGDRLYFRVQPLANGASDTVEWDPTIDYVGADDETDVNGLKLWHYSGSGDFTTAGARGMFVGLPFDGRVKVQGTINKTHATSDDAKVEIIRTRGTGPTAVSTVICCDQIIHWDETGTFPINEEFDVVGPHKNGEGTDDDTPGDRIYVRLAVDTNIDVQAFSWAPALTYLSATDDGGHPVATTLPNGDPALRIALPYDLPIYPNTDHFDQITEDGGNQNNSEFAMKLTATAIADQDLPATVILTVKRKNRLVTKSKLTIPARGPQSGWTHVCGPNNTTTADDCFIVDDFFPWHPEDDEFYFDFTFENGTIANKTTIFTSEGQPTKWWGGSRIFGDTTEAFPPPYRGWGYAGYNGTAERGSFPINEADLLIPVNSFPDQDHLPDETLPMGDRYKDPAYRNPVRGNAYIYMPFPERALWQGPKDPGQSGLTGATWGSANRMAASLLGPDSLGAPSDNVIGQGASAPSIEGRADTDAAGASAGSIIPTAPGVGVAWARSVGDVDFMDLNGDGYPDVIGDEVQFTDQVGALEPEGRDIYSGDMRFDHEFANDLSGGGSPAAVSVDASGQGTTPKDAGGGGKKGKGHQGGGGDGSGGGDGGGGGGGKKSKSGKSFGKGVKKAAKVGVSLGVEGGIGYSETNSQDTGKMIDTDLTHTEGDFADMNGDGLPDRVTVSTDGTVEVEWNLGYSFSSPAHWPSGQSLEEGGSGNKSIGIGLGFSIHDLEFSAGASLTLDAASTDVTWEDVNGDDLADRLSAVKDWSTPTDFIERPHDGVMVEINTGSGLLAPMLWDDFRDSEIAKNETIALGGGADFSIGIGPLCIYVCFIIINPGAHGEEVHSATTNDLIDVDGDGYVDSVSSDENDELFVSRNRTGRTNLLKSVTNPLGGSMTFGYEREGNTTDYPASTWVLSDLKVNDGHSGDGADVQHSTFEYKNAKYDFGEREDYGFAEVIERQHDTLNDDRVMRSWKYNYANTSYYERGQLKQETLYGPEPNAKPLTATVNTFKYVDSTTGLLANLQSLTGSVFPYLVTEQQQLFDAAGAVVKTSDMNFTFDRRGNLVKIADLGEPAIAGDDVTADMRFTDCAPGSPDSGSADEGDVYPWTQLADALVVRSGTTVLQRRIADVDCNTASVSEVRDYLNANAPADINNELKLESDDAGNCPISGPVHTPPSVTSPDYSTTIVCYLPVGGQTSAIEHGSNAVGQRYRVTYAYDTIGNNVTRTGDSYGMVTNMTFDNRFGKVQTVTDPLGAVTSYVYDDRGRLSSVTGPLQQGTGRKTIDYDYHASDRPAWALAKHVDVTSTRNPPNTIDTVSFIDGLDREIQTKKDATIFQSASTAAADRMVVSGRIWFDAAGRTVREAYPTIETLGTPGVFRPTAAAEQTTTTFDALDRVTRLDEPGPRVTTSTYGFAAGPFAAPMVTELRQDPETGRTRTYSDIRSNLVGVERLHRLPNGTDQVLFARNDYDALQRLVKVTDVNRFVTTSTYDLLGRRTIVDNPDTGKVETRYDAASNVVAEITPALRAQNKQITLTYEFERLTGIQYPNNPASNETYEYGAPGVTANNTAGLLTRVNDGAKTTTYKYDKLGQPIEEAALIKFTTLPARSYTTKHTYDTWGRALNMTYPDGEVLTYGYDSGGLAKSATGVKNGITYPYVSRLEYDKFDNRQFMANGNGTTTEVSFDANTLWPTRQRVLRGSTVLSDLNYAYDRVGDVLARNDLRPTTPSAYTDPGGPSQQSYLYDDLHRLVSSTGTYTYPANKIRSYTYDLTYDDAGRVTRRTQTDRVNGQVQVGTTFDNAYTYGSVQPHGPSRVGPHRLTYDADGNVASTIADVTNSTRAFGYDEEDRLKSITEPGQPPMGYKYDFDDELTIRSTSTAEMAFVNDTYTSYTSNRHFKNVIIDDLEVATREVAGFIEQQPNYFANDLLDSTYLVTDGTGKAVESTQFLPSGEIWDRVQSSVARERDLFAGSYFDEAAKLDQLEARWYDPHDGLMYSPDPVISESLDDVVGEPQLLSALSYAEDNPSSFVDATGEDGNFAVDGWTLGEHAKKRMKTKGVKVAKQRPTPHSYIIFRTGPENKGREKVESIVGWADPVGALTEVSFEFSGFKLKEASIGKIKIGKTFKSVRKKIKK